jgi:hypothetical protein
MEGRMDFLPWVQRRIIRKEYLLSRHAQLERLEEDINIQDIQTAILRGILLEDYPEDPRGHSALISGFSDGRFIHVVCGQKKNWAIIITVYIPKPPVWETAEKRGKRGTL